MLKTPVIIQLPKLNRAEPSQYSDRGLLGNTSYLNQYLATDNITLILVYISSMTSVFQNNNPKYVLTLSVNKFKKKKKIHFRHKSDILD